jgi:hypothetical protein
MDINLKLMMDQNILDFLFVAIIVIWLWISSNKL